MQPDLVVLCDLENNINEKGKYFGTPALTLEVISKSTKSKDMVLKLNTYMSSGVSEYWIVDPHSERITIYTFSNYQIDKTEVYKKGETTKSEIFEGLSTDINQLFSEVL